MSSCSLFCCLPLHTKFKDKSKTELNKQHYLLEDESSNSRSPVRANYMILQTATDSFLSAVSSALASRLNTFIEDNQILPYTHQKQYIIPNFTGCILQFLQMVHRVVELTTVEAAHIIHLINVLVHQENPTPNTDAEHIITAHNVGTVLLCATIIVLKCDRDNQPKNGWWARGLGMSHTLINNSELLFLLHIRFTTILTPEAYMSIVDEMLERMC